MGKTPDLSEFYKLSKPKRPPCQIGFVLEQVSEEHAEQLTAALATDNGIITATAIAQWLQARGHEVSHQRIVNHRKRTCTCYGK